MINFDDMLTLSLVVIPGVIPGMILKVITGVIPGMILGVIPGMILGVIPGSYSDYCCSLFSPDSSTNIKNN